MVSNSQPESEEHSSAEPFFLLGSHSIDSLTHEQMARLLRFAPPEHPYLDTADTLNDIFMARWESFGGWNPELSKKIGHIEHPNE